MLSNRLLNRYALSSWVTCHGVTVMVFLTDQNYRRTSLEILGGRTGPTRGGGVWGMLSWEVLKNSLFK